MLSLSPTKGGISESLSPKTVISGKTLDFRNHLRLQLVHYCQIHEEEIPHSIQAPITKGEICLGPSGNLQGRCNFMALNSGKKIFRRKWDFIPMPDTVITRINTLGVNQPKLLTFTDKHGRLIGDVEIPGVGANSN